MPHALDDYVDSMVDSVKSVMRLDWRRVSTNVARRAVQ